ncbi:MAG: methyltransferase [Formosimonas sp.]
MEKIINWHENGQERSARWQSESGANPPKRVVVVDDTLSAQAAHRYAAEGVGMLWRGDFQNARLLLQALARRLDKHQKPAPPTHLTEAFHQHRAAQIQRARLLSLLLIELDGDYVAHLRRAPDVALACQQIWGVGGAPLVLSLRELQGLIGAFEWRKRGVHIDVLGESIYPHYGVFSPVRGEYLDLVAHAPLPSGLELALDIGAGTGVLSVILARRGVPRLWAIEQDERALACAQDNLQRLGLTGQVQLHKADLFPAQAAGAQLIVCNPPWLPAKANAPIEHAVYDPNSRMLKGFLAGLTTHLSDDGEGWLIVSDLAERLGLRSRDELLSWIAAAGLTVVGRLDARPKHAKAFDATDVLYAARSQEVTSLWRLAKQSA